MALTVNLRINETVHIGKDITIRFIHKARGNKTVRIQIDAPDDTKILRGTIPLKQLEEAQNDDSNT